MKLITFKKAEGNQPILVNADSIDMVEVYEHAGDPKKLLWTIHTRSAGHIRGLLPLNNAGEPVAPEDHTQCVELFKNYVHYSIRNYYD